MKKSYFKKIISAAVILGVPSVPHILVVANEVTSDSNANGQTEISSQEALTSTSSEVLSKEIQVESSEMFQVSEEEALEEDQGLDINYFDDINMYPVNRSDIEMSREYARSFSSSPKAITPNVSITDTNTPQKGFIDISSHNGYLSVEDFKKMKNYGITGVVVKLTEATTYVNPEAANQVANAKKAGLKVSAYHYSWFTDEAGARREAEYFVNVAKQVGLHGDTVMVNDIEEPKITGKADHTKTSLAFQKRLNELGYNNVTHYMGAHWLNSGLINPAELGYKNIWVAAYPYTLSTDQQYSEYGTWQWSAKLSFPGISGTFDISSDYSSRYTNQIITEKPLYQGIREPKMGLWYRSHVADLGWLGFVGTEDISGTSGQNRRLEAVDVMWDKQKDSIRSSYQVLRGSWVEVGNEITGTVGKAQGMQKVCFASNQSLLDTGRKIQYRVHSEDVGWSTWKEEGVPAGTTGKKIEAIEMRMVKNGVVEKG